MSVEAGDERRRAWGCCIGKAHVAASLPGALPHKERPSSCRDCPYLQSLGRLQAVCVSGSSRKNSCESRSARQETTKTATLDGRAGIVRPSRARAAPETSRKWQIMMSESWKGNSVTGKCRWSRITRHSSLVSKTMPTLHSLSPADWPLFGRLVDMQGLSVARQRPHPVSLSPWGVGVWGAESSLTLDF